MRREVQSAKFTPYANPHAELADTSEFWNNLNGPQITRINADYVHLISINSGPS
jgi:hypothetical protein